MAPVPPTFMHALRTPSAQRLLPRAVANLLFCALACGGLACTSIPAGRTAVSAVDVEGTSAVDEDDILEKNSTTASPQVLKLWSDAHFDYSLYDAFTLKRDLLRVERFYQARGYYSAHARVARVQRTDDNKVRVTIEVEEGEPTRVRSVVVRGIEKLPPAVQKAALAAVNKHVRKDATFDEDEYQEGEQALHRALGEAGYAYAKVRRSAKLDLPERGTDVAYDAEPDRPSTIGKITIDGFGTLPEAPVWRALDLTEGEAYSVQKLDNAQQAVLNLGVFSTVDLDPTLSDPPPEDRVVPIRVHLEPIPLHSVKLGAGIELDMIKTDIHAITQWEAKNFLGGLRHLTLRDKPGLVFWPTRLPDFEKPSDILPENRLRAELKQPGFLEARTLGTLRAEYNIFPLILGPEQAKASTAVLGYHQLIGSAGLERQFWKFTVAPQYNLEGNIPFAYVGSRTIGPVVVSHVDALVTLDLRDDKVHPRKGLFTSFDLQFAGLGGDARDVRMQPDVRGYVPVGKRVVIAARASVGFLFPMNYLGTYGQYAPGGLYPADPVAEADWTRDLQLMFFRGFYSGGTSGNRGYALRGVGPHGAVPFFNPDVATQQFASECNARGATTAGLEDARDPRCFYPLGGQSLWEASLEVRIPVSGPFSVVTFCDASDVSARRLDLRFNRPHLSCGGGVRYDTPVGPIRLDVGYRIPGAQTLGLTEQELRDEGPSTTNHSSTLLFGAFPGAIAFGIGESF